MVMRTGMIAGWGLQLPKASELFWFDYVVLGEPEGCTEPYCSHATHDPAAPRAAWFPRAGVKILGYVYGPLNRTDYVEAYFAAARDSEVRFYRYVKPTHYWARVEPVDLSDVPASIWGQFLVDKVRLTDSPPIVYGPGLGFVYGPLYP